MFAEMFPPARLPVPAIQTLPTAYKHLRDWLNKRGADLAPHSSNRITMTLAVNLYEESEGTTAAVDLVKAIISQS